MSTTRQPPLFERYPELREIAIKAAAAIGDANQTAMQDLQAHLNSLAREFEAKKLDPANEAAWLSALADRFASTQSKQPVDTAEVYKVVATRIEDIAKAKAAEQSLAAPVPPMPQAIPGVVDIEAARRAAQEVDLSDLNLSLSGTTVYDHDQEQDGMPFGPDGPELMPAAAMVDAYRPVDFDNEDAGPPDDLVGKNLGARVNPAVMTDGQMFEAYPVLLAIANEMRDLPREEAISAIREELNLVATHFKDGTMSPDMLNTWTIPFLKNWDERIAAAPDDLKTAFGIAKARAVERFDAWRIADENEFAQKRANASPPPLPPDATTSAGPQSNFAGANQTNANASGGKGANGGKEGKGGSDDKKGGGEEAAQNDDRPRETQITGIGALIYGAGKLLGGGFEAVGNMFEAAKRAVRLSGTTSSAVAQHRNETLAQKIDSAEAHAAEASKALDVLKNKSFDEYAKANPGLAAEGPKAQFGSHFDAVTNRVVDNYSKSATELREAAGMASTAEQASRVDGVRKKLADLLKDARSLISPEALEKLAEAMRQVMAAVTKMLNRLGLGGATNDARYDMNAPAMTPSVADRASFGPRPG